MQRHVFRTAMLSTLAVALGVVVTYADDKNVAKKKPVKKAKTIRPFLLIGRPLPDTGKPPNGYQAILKDYRDA